MQIWVDADACPGVIKEILFRAAQRTGIMTTLVATCGLDSSVDDLSELMTENRVRHIPVVVDGRLAGIVSIGDVVKTRMDELQTERQHLRAYITQG